MYEVILLSEAQRVYTSADRALAKKYPDALSNWNSLLAITLISNLSKGACLDIIGTESAIIELFTPSMIRQVKSLFLRSRIVAMYTIKYRNCFGY